MAACPEDRRSHSKQDIEDHIQRKHPDCYQPVIDFYPQIMDQVEVNAMECYPHNFSKAADPGGAANLTDNNASTAMVNNSALF